MERQLQQPSVINVGVILDRKSVVILHYTTKITFI